MTTIRIEDAADQSVAGRLDALRCDHVKASLYPARHRIAVAILALVQEDPTLKDTDKDVLRSLCTEAMFYFGDEVFDALQGLTVPPSGPETLTDKLRHLETVLKSYFDLRTLK